MKQFILAFAALSLGIPSGHCGSAKITGEREISAPPANKPTVVYVADFDLDAADIKAEKGLLPPPPKLPGPLGNALPPPPGAPKDPQKLARELVDEMSEALVKELTKAVFTARRLPSANTLPASGWLVRGVFTDVDDTITTHGALDFLARLASGALLSTPSTLLLLKIMTETSTGPNRLKAGLPAGAALAHKTGTGPVVLGVNAATNDMGIVTLADHRRYALAAFVAGCPAPETVREGLIADFARLAVKAAG